MEEYKTWQGSAHMLPCYTEGGISAGNCVWVSYWIGNMVEARGIRET